MDSSAGECAQNGQEMIQAVPNSRERHRWQMGPFGGTQGLSRQTWQILQKPGPSWARMPGDHAQPWVAGSLGLSGSLVREQRQWVGVGAQGGGSHSGQTGQLLGEDAGRTLPQGLKWVRSTCSSHIHEPRPCDRHLARIFSFIHHHNFLAPVTCQVPPRSFHVPPVI